MEEDIKFFVGLDARSVSRWRANWQALSGLLHGPEPSLRRTESAKKLVKVSIDLMIATWAHDRGNPRDCYTGIPQGLIMSLRARQTPRRIDERW
jgi:hypothetical protein